MSKAYYDSSPDAPKEGLEAEYQMWGYDFKRLNAVLEAITALFLALPDNPEAALALSFALKEFYSAIRILFVPPKKKEYDKRFDALIIFIQKELVNHRQWAQMGQHRPLNTEVFKRLDTMRDDLLEMRQIVGLGIPAQRKMNKRARLKGALTGQ